MGALTNTLEGPNPDEMKAGELYRVVHNGETQIGETVLALEKIGEASEEKPESSRVKLVLDLPENAYNVLNEMSVAYGQSVDLAARDMIFSLMESDLEGGTGQLSDALAKQLCKKFNYDPEGWRKEAS